MSYTKKTWKNYPDTTTPITADNLNHMENGIADAHTDIAALNTSLLQHSTFPSGVGFYPDEQDGKQGYNTSPSRGADTFYPFSSTLEVVEYETIKPNSYTWSKTYTATDDCIIVASGFIAGVGTYALHISYSGEYVEASVAPDNTYGGVGVFKLNKGQTITVSFSSHNANVASYGSWVVLA